MVTFALALSAQSTLTIDATPGLKDVTIRGGTYAAVNFEGDVLVTRASSNPTYERHSLFEFDTRAIPPTATIHSAAFTLTVKTGGTAPSRSIGIYPLTRNVATTQATWDVATASTPWTKPGGDFGALVSTGTAPNNSGAKVTFDVTTAIQPGSVTGFAAVDIDTLTDARAGYREYYPVETATAELRPSLTVTYASAVSAPGILPRFSHVFTIVLENHDYTDIIGSASAPYTNTLATQYGLATSYSGVAHPSLPNYMALTGGKTVFTNDCQGCTTGGTSIVDQVESSGRTWKAYMEGMPAPCGIADSGRYAQKHDPFVHYQPIVGDQARCDGHVVPLPAFTTDLQNNRLPNYAWITPDMCHDMHDCSVQTGDTWLSTFVPKIIASPAFANSVVFVVWDEGRVSSTNHVPLLVVSPMTKAGTRSSSTYNHYSLLHTVESAWGLAPLGGAGSASTLTPFFR